MDFLKCLLHQDKEPLADSRKYHVVAGSLVVSPGALVKSDKVKQQIESLRNKKQGAGDRSSKR